MMMKSVLWWRKPEYPEETTDLWQVTDETCSHIRPLPSPGIELGPQRCVRVITYRHEPGKYNSPLCDAGRGDSHHV